MRSLLPRFALLLVAVGGTVAVAAPITVTYSGTIVERAVNPLPFFLGDPFTVTFTYDPNTPGTISGLPDPSFGVVSGQYPNAVTGLTLTVGSYTAYADDGAGIEILNDYPRMGLHSNLYDLFFMEIINSDPSPVKMHGAPLAGGLVLNGFALQFADPTHMAFTSVSLPLTALDPRQFVSPVNNPVWPDTVFLLSFAGSDPGSGGTIYGAFTTTPEPRTEWILGATFMLLISWRHRRLHKR